MIFSTQLSYNRHGVPIDPLDKICHNHYRCSKCTEMDKGCNPLKENYKLLLDTDSFEFTCSADNSPCESIACSCDIELIKSLISKVDMYDPYFSSTDNNFNPSQERFSHHCRKESHQTF